MLFSPFIFVPCKRNSKVYDLGNQFNISPLYSNYLKKPTFHPYISTDIDCPASCYCTGLTFTCDRTDWDPSSMGKIPANTRVLYVKKWHFIILTMVSLLSLLLEISRWYIMHPLARTWFLMSYESWVYLDSSLWIDTIMWCVFPSSRIINNATKTRYKRTVSNGSTTVESVLGTTLHKFTFLMIL